MSARVVLDGKEEGTIVTVYFNRTDGIQEPLYPGQVVRAQRLNDTSVGLEPVAAKLDAILTPEEAARRTGISLQSERPVPTNGARVTALTR